MGFYGANLWDLWGPMFLRCGTYGIRMGLWECGVALMGHKPLDLWGPMGIYGDLCFCGVGPMGFVGVYGIAVWHLWGTSC